MKTPTGKQHQIYEATAEKSSGRKMIQPRLPFKIITSAELTSPSSVSTTTSIVEPAESTVNQPAEDCTSHVPASVRKRRLSYEGNCKSVLPSPDRKENLSAASTKKTKTETMETEIIMLDDSEDGSLNAEVTDIKYSDDCASPSTSTQSSNNRKGAGTSKNMVASENMASKGNTPKLQIKLPRSNKKKRKKSQGNSSVIEDVKSRHESTTESSDDIEMIAEELNPQKRQKIAETKKEQFHDAVKEGSDDSENSLFAAEKENNKLEGQIIHINEKPDTQKNTDTQITQNDVIILNSDSEDTNGVTISTNFSKSPAKNFDGSNKPSEGKKFDGKSKSKRVDISTNLAMNISNVEVADEAAEDDEDVVETSASSVVEEVNSELDDKSIEENSESTISKSAEHSESFNKDELSAKQHAAGITPKQQRLMEQRRMAREAKERKLQEEKLQKQREKEEKELARKLEREEKEEQKRKEREEKEEVKRKEREERERKRLAEIEAKNEERRKRIEVKEEERKRKEQEKEEAENKKKKAAEAFTKFFVPKTTRLSVAVEACQQNATSVEGGGGKSELLAFRPFQIKGDMKLAPLCRKVFTEAARENLDCYVCEEKQNASENTLPRSQLYISELRAGRIVPGKWRRPTCDTKEEDDDVILIEDELESAAQTIVEERSRSVQRFRAKFYKFHENRRPPYFGTWRKKTVVITPRRPLALDKEFFDYEVDSDLEWEEEEPGESVDGSDDEKEKESEDDDYEVDNEWFVPHGHLSDEELQNEDEGGDDNTREAQKAKLKIIQQEFDQEMKKKTKKIKPRLVGCIWQDYNGKQPQLCPNIIWESLNMRAMLYTAAPLLEEAAAEPAEGIESNSPTTNAGGASVEKLKRILLTDTMVKDLVRLVHGNRHSKAFLINEFIAYIEQTEDGVKNGDLRGPLKSVVRDKIDEFALWRVMESNNNAKSKKNKKKLCWVASEDKLKEYGMQDLQLHNKWSYTLRPKFVETHDQNGKKTSTDEYLAEGEGMATSEKNSSLSSQKAITKFTKVLTADEKDRQLQHNADDSNNDAAAEAVRTKNSSSDHSATPSCTQTTKAIVKKRVSLLISTPRGQQISTPVKNALISQYLQKNKDAADKAAASTAEVASVENEVVVLLD